LENVKLNQRLFETIARTGTPPPFNEPTSENTLRGVGPGIGAMGRAYPIHGCPQWSVFAGLMTSVLYGRHQFTEIFFSSNSGNFYIYNPEESKALVGKLDIQFGLNYHHSLRHEMHGMKWDITLGMRYMNMFNALKNGNTAWQPNANGNGGNIQNFSANLGPAQDWGRYGPFLKFMIGGAHS